MKYPYGQTAYNRSLRPAGSNDIMLGRNLGTGCQLKYADDLFQISQTQLPDTSYMCTGQSPIPDTSVSDEHATRGEIGTLVTAKHISRRSYGDLGVFDCAATIK